MQDLRELLNQAKTNKPDAIDEKLEWSKWGKAKHKLNSLTAEYEKFIETKIKESPEKVSITTKTSGTIYEYISQVNGYEASLIWKKRKKKEDTAYYVLWNPILGRCYIRDLTELNENVQPDTN